MTAPTLLSPDTAVAVYTELLNAWNQQDAATYAALFAEEGGVVGFDGSQMNGRTAIETELARIFADHPTARYVAKVREVRPLDDHALLLRAVVGMVARGKSELNPALNAVQSLILVQANEGARIAFFQNTPAAFHGRPQLVEELTRELALVLDSGQVVV